VQVVLRAVAAIGHLASTTEGAAQLDAAVEGLFTLSGNKAEEVQFAVGEALCFVFGGALRRVQLQAGSLLQLV